MSVINTTDTKRRRFIVAVKGILFVLVLWYVGRKGFELSQSTEWQQFSIKPGWLVAAAVLYLIGWLPSVWVWQRMMRLLGARPPFLLSLKAYYFGHLGKYVPGKAAAIAVRTTTLQTVGVPIGTSLATALLETLMVMGVGLSIGIALCPLLLSEDVWQQLPPGLRLFRERLWLGPLLLLIGIGTAVPLTAKWLVRFAQKRAQQRAGDIEPSRNVVVSTQQWIRELMLGLAVFIPTWFAQGLSLGCVLLSLGVVESISLLDWLLWTGAIGIGNSLGFFVLFAPGGLGVREVILMAALSPTIGEPAAITVSGLLRLVWLFGEVIASVLLAIASQLLRDRK